jgi:dihydrofolate reductase
MTTPRTPSSARSRAATTRSTRSSSPTLTPGQTGPWEATTRIVPRADATAVATELRSGDGGDILVFGSRTMWNHLLVAGLVDELHLMLGPALLGVGQVGHVTLPSVQLMSVQLIRAAIVRDSP